MRERFTRQHIEAWRRDGGVVIERFFDADEVAAVRADFDRLFARASGGDAPLVKTKPGETRSLQRSAVHGVRRDSVRLLEGFESDRRASGVDRVRPSGAADDARAPVPVPGVGEVHRRCRLRSAVPLRLRQPHADRAVGRRPAELRDDPVLLQRRHRSARSRALCRAHRQRESGGARSDAAAQIRICSAACESYERSSAAPAGSIFPYGIDVFHRGTNMTAPRGHRYAVMACFKDAANDTIGYHAWPFHHLKPWHRIFDHATPEQLACFGVHPPGHPFWTPTTLARARARYPNWDMTPYAEKLRPLSSTEGPAPARQ